MEPDQSCIIPIQLVIAVDDVNGDPLRFVTPALAEAIQELNHNNPHPDNRPDQPHLNNGSTETAQPEPASDYFQPLERALQELDNHNHNDIQPVENTLLQEIENHDIPPLENPLPPIDPHDIQSRRRDRFGNLEFRQTFKVPPIANVGDLAQFYEDVLNHFNALAERVRPEVRPNDIVQVEIIAENAQEHDIIQVGDTGVDFQNVFEGLLERLIQSNRELDADSPLEVVIQVVKNPRGGAGDKRKLKKTLVSEIVNKKKKHLHVVPNVNNKLCFTISLALLINTDFTYIQAVEHARELHHLAGLTEATAVAFSHINKFEQIVNRKIVVFYRDAEDRALSHFETQYPKSDQPVFLFLLNEHYYGIKNLKGFLGVDNVCHYCYRGYCRSESHSCPGHCNLCFDPTCDTAYSDPVYCADCNRTSRTRACYVKHKKSLNDTTLSTCQKIHKCSNCKCLFSASTEHKCMTLKCKVCGVHKGDEPHQCYIQPVKFQENQTQDIFFYDFETFVNDKGEHMPYLVCAESLQGEKWMSYGLDCVEKFLMKFRKPQYKKATFIAHNARGFDSYLILRGLIDLGMSPSLVMQGSKIICFTETDYLLRFIDSLSFLTMKLAAMPKALGFADQSKGFFPHKFSKEKHLKYIGPYPPPADYGVESMSAAQQNEFYSWYKEASRGVFNFEKEAVFYCQNDTNILRKGCMKFREEFVGETHVDPFSCVTISSASMKVFLTNFLVEKTLAIPSPDDYRRQFKKFSSCSIQWLEWLMYSKNIFIQHALNRGEKKIGTYFVDGYAAIEGLDCAYEFQGCFYHGCPTCFRPHDICPMTGIAFEEMHSASQEKLHQLRSTHGLHTEVMTEHAWTLMKKTHAGVREFMKKYDPPEPLAPRAALYGGRTSALRLRYTAGADESVHYVDVTSLYPYVNATGSYPLGHPVIIHRDFDEIENYFGLIRATVIPPRGLYFPVLPYKTAQGKLVFTLCRTCSETNNQSDSCSHDDVARALTGVWVSAELHKAVQMGYKVSKLSEVWHFEAQSSNLFVEYIHTFLKGKQEASGFPAEAVDDESRKKYIRDYELHQGIRLNPEKIETNPAKRQVSKACLNGFWGKFAQRSNLVQTTLVKSAEHFFTLVFSGQYTLKHVSFLPTNRGDVALIQWLYNDRCVVPPGRSSNVFIAAFTTAYGRLKLYSYLERLQQNILYVDTDSLIYVIKENETPLELGNYLGDLTDELRGDTIHEFVAAGPKSYAYQTKNEKKVVMKVKGITQTRECSELINFDSTKELVEGYLEGSKERFLETPQQTIKRDKNGFLLKNATFKKKFRVVYDKRRVFPDGTTLPFGY